MVLQHWESKNTEDLADMLGRSRASICAMAATIRREGIPLARKRKKNSINLLVKEVIAEM